MLEQQPDVERAERAEHEEEDDRREQPREDPCEPLHRRRRHDRGAVLQRQERIGLAQARARAVGGGEHAERPQLLLDEEADVVGADAAPEALGHDVGDLRLVALAVGGLGDEVQQLGELDDLPVRAAGEVRRVLEPRVLELAEQLDALGEARRERAWRALPARAGMASLGGHERRAPTR